MRHGGGDRPARLLDMDTIDGVSLVAVPRVADVRYPIHLSRPATVNCYGSARRAIWTRAKSPSG